LDFPLNALLDGELGEPLCLFLHEPMLLASFCFQPHGFLPLGAPLQLARLVGLPLSLQLCPPQPLTRGLSSSLCLQLGAL